MFRMESALNTKSLAAGLLLTAVPTLAHAIDVYPGCAVPALKAGHHTFYVDPVKGDDKGDGSAAKPWKDLNTVIGTYTKLLSSNQWLNNKQSYVPWNPKGPIKPGDAIMLMSGNYGTVKVLNAFNDDFVWVIGAPGQTPVIRQLNVVSSAKWVFQGIRFVGETPNKVSEVGKKPFDGQVTAGVGDYTGTTNSIVFDSDHIATSDSNVGWSPQDWILKPYYTTFESVASCVSLTNSNIINTYNAALLGGTKNLLQAVIIDGFSNDGIDLTNSNITIRHNIIRNGVNSKIDPLHADGIQGWSNIVKGSPVQNSNVLIDGNQILKYGDPNLTYLQGISVFDGKWDNLVIQNNLVVTNTLNGISVFGTTNSKVVNNTIIASGPVQTLLWTSHDKTGATPSNLVVRNNIAPVIAVGEKGTVYDHNIFNSKLIALQNGKVVTLTNTSDTQSSSMLIPDTSRLFVNATTTAQAMNAKLKAGSPAVGTGKSTDAPVTDLLGIQRTAPASLGAYTN